MVWKPNVTVAAVICRDGRFLLVEEETETGLAFNQPAGHLEEGESLVEAVIREVREETAYDFRPTHLLGVYNWRHAGKGITYLRFAFVGDLVGHDPARPLDKGIVAARWMTLEEIAATAGRHRSVLIQRGVDDYLAGKRFPLDLLVHYAA